MTVSRITLRIPSAAARVASLVVVCSAACVLVLPAAAAPAPPTALTGPVSAVAPTSATLNGTVNPNGTATSWEFEYGTATSYGSQTAPQNAGSGSSETAVSANLSGLVPGTTYHYRLDATSAAGTSQGSDGIFTTSSAPGALTAAATNLTASSATLNGTVQPNGQQTSYSFQYGKTTSYGSSTPTSAAGSGTSSITVSASLTGLESGQSYHFRLVAVNAAGTTDGPDVSFTLSPAPTATTSPATALSASGAQLHGSVNPNGQQTSWHFDYGPTTSYGSSTPAVAAGSGSRSFGVSANLSGLSAGTIYHFRLVATSAAGTGTGGDSSFVTTMAPSVQTGSAEGAGPTSVTLTGSVNPKGSATHWYFQFGTTTAYGSQTAAVNAGSGNATAGVSASVAKLLPGTSYHYRLVAVSSAGTSDGGDVTFSTPPAVTLTAETTEAVFGHALTLSGTAAGLPAGAKLSVLAEPYGQSSFTTLATVLTGDAGSWSYQARPAIATVYEASAPAGTSAPLAIGVRPAITLRLITGARFLVRVAGSTAFAGRTIKMQRLGPRGGWTTVARSRLNPRSAAVIAARVLPKGSSTIRIAMSINQAGRGYLAGFSRTLVFVRS